MNTYKYNHLKTSLFTLAIIALSTFAGLSQQTMFGNEEITKPGLPNVDPKEKELKTFVEVYDQLIELEAQHNLKIIEIVQDHEMDLGRYETIAAAKRLYFEIETNPGEMAKYKSIKKEIERNKAKTKQKMLKVLNDYQMNRGRYGRILLKLKKDTSFRAKVDSLRSENPNPFK